MIKSLLLLLFVVALSFAKIIDFEMYSNSLLSDRLVNIKILDAKELEFKSINSIEVKELSALAYKDKKLYVLGDKGKLFHFDISIQGDRIQELSLVKAFKLKNTYGEVLKKSHRDSEGLCFIEDELLVSFERKPRIDVYSLHGIKEKKKKIHKDLREIKNYRDKNDALESVAYNKKYGAITAPEKSLKAQSKDAHIIYAKKDTWKIPKEGSITALEFMNEDTVMVLQRKFNNFTRRRVVTISSLNLENSEYKVLASLDTKDGWNLDNFEGLTKVDENKYLMISDDNDSFFQKTLLVLFEVF